MQQQVIRKKNEKINDAKNTVTEELKSYCFVVQNTCTAALAQRNIVSAVKTVKAEDHCSRDLLVFGIAEEVGESVQTKVSELLEQLDEKPKIMDSKRIGKCAAG